MQVEEFAMPRQPQRANGVERYNLLLQATQRLIENEGADVITIQGIAAEANVPMASVYHFFPSPTAACVALAQLHLENFAELLVKPVRKTSNQTFNSYVSVLMKRIIDYYHNTPSALILTLGSNHSWRIRQVDIINNSRLPTAIAAALEKRFIIKNKNDLQRKLTIAITISESIWGLSVAEKGRITKAYADESLKVVTNYLESSLDVKML